MTRGSISRVFHPQAYTELFRAELKFMKLWVKSGFFCDASPVPSAAHDTSRWFGRPMARTFFFGNRHDFKMHHDDSKNGKVLLCVPFVRQFCGPSPFANPCPVLLPTHHSAGWLKTEILICDEYDNI